jgi:hypothetical protein
MTLYNISNNTGGMDNILVDTMTSVGSFIPLLLVFTFFVVFLGGIGRQKARTGTADFPMWAVVASISTLLLSLIMTLVEGLIRLEWLSIIIVVTIFSGVWLFLDKKNGEM